MCFICWRRMVSRSLFPSSCCMSVISRLTLSTSSWREIISMTSRTRFLHVEALEHALLILHAGHLGREAGSEKIGEGTRLADVVENAGDLFGQCGVEIVQLASGVTQGSAEGVELYISHERLGDASHAGAHVGFEAHAGCHAESADTAELDGIDGGADANDLGRRARGVPILCRSRKVGSSTSGLFWARIPMEARSMPRASSMRADASGASYVDRDHGHGEQHGVAQGQDRDVGPLLGRRRRTWKPWGDGNTDARQSQAVSSALARNRANRYEGRCGEHDDPAQARDPTNRGAQQPVEPARVPPGDRVRGVRGRGRCDCAGLLWFSAAAERPYRNAAGLRHSARSGAHRRCLRHAER